MKLFLALLFISALATCFAAGQSEPGSQHSVMPTQDQQITNGPVAEYVSASNCTIGWSAHGPATMTLRYGTDRTKMTKTAEATGSKDGRNYHVQLAGLTPGTRYYFRVFDAGEPISGVGTFQTVEQGEAPIRSKAIVPQ